MLIKSLIALQLLLPFVSLSQQINLDQFYYSDFQPIELNTDAKERIDILYKNYIDRYGDESTLDEKKFVYEYNFFLDRLNRSGKVFYGDEISVYLNQLKDYIIDDPALRSQITVYLADSPYLNAFTNDFGNIYVNVASIAKINSEEELLYLLAHEISHVMKRHSREMEIFVASTENDYWGNKSDETLFDRHSFSRNQELEADDMAIVLLKDKVDADAMRSLLHRLEHSNNPVFLGETSLNLLFENNASLRGLLEQSWKRAGLDTLMYEVKNGEDSLSTHPTISSRIEHLQSSLQDYQAPIHSPIGDFQHMKELASYVLINTYMESDFLSEALDLILKLRQNNQNDPFLKNKQLSTLTLLSQKKYVENPFNRILNEFGNSCNDRDFLQLKYFLLKLNRLDMTLLSKQLAPSLIGPDLESEAALKYLNRIIYYNHPDLFEESAQITTPVFKEWCDTSMIVRFTEEFIKADAKKALKELTNNGIKLIQPSDSSFLLKAFIDESGLDSTFFEAVVSWNQRKMESAGLNNQFDIMLHPAKASYKYSRGEFEKAKRFDYAAKTAILQIDNFCFTSKHKINFEIDYEGTLELDSKMKELNKDYNSYEMDFSNMSRKETSVADNYIHRIGVNWIIDHAFTNEPVYSACEDEISRILASSDTRYLAYTICIVNKNKGLGRRNYMNYYELYFDIRDGNLVYSSKIGSKERQVKFALEQFLYLSRHHKTHTSK